MVNYMFNGEVVDSKVIGKKRTAGDCLDHFPTPRD